MEIATANGWWRYGRVEVHLATTIREGWCLMIQKRILYSHSTLQNQMHHYVQHSLRYAIRWQWYCRYLRCRTGRLLESRAAFLYQPKLKHGSKERTTIRSCCYAFNSIETCALVVSEKEAHHTMARWRKCCGDFRVLGCWTRESCVRKLREPPRQLLSRQATDSPLIEGGEMPNQTLNKYMYGKKQTGKNLDKILSRKGEKELKM